MKTEHTPEPWERLDSRVYFPNLAGGFSLHNCPDAEANARRIVACVNACKGIPTDVLEHAENFGAAGIKTVESLREQRDELLAAIDTVVKAIMIFRNEPTLQRLHALRSSNGYGVLQQAMDIGLDVIASVKEKA